MTFKVRMTVERDMGENDRGYAQTETVAEFKVEADPLKALNVYQAALSALTSGDSKVSLDVRPGKIS